MLRFTSIFVLEFPYAMLKKPPARFSSHFSMRVHQFEGSSVLLST